jgi:deazaflavin-dependent oxidoreductase (nitroreductase family)
VLYATISTGGVAASQPVLNLAAEGSAQPTHSSAPSRTACHHGDMPDDDMASEREFNENNIEEFRRNGGKVGGQFEGFPLLLLTSTGAKSGTERINLIGYFDIDDKIYIVGSAAGREKSPAWVFNIRAHPDVLVEIGSDPPRDVVANELPRDERDRIYEVVKERAPGFAEYEKRTDRVIPVFELATKA